MAAGDSAQLKADGLRAIKEKFEKKLATISRLLDAQEKGAEGERVLAELLEELAPLGFRRLDDRCLPNSNGNLDHVLMGPTGVFVIDAKNWTAPVSIRGGTLRAGRYARPKEVAKVAAQAKGLCEIFESVLPGNRVSVTPVVCFVGEAKLGRHHELDGVHLLDDAHIADFVTDGSPLLSDRTVGLVHAYLSSRIAARTSARTPPRAARPPAEPLVFLTPWKKSGRHRVYVKSVDGDQLGFLDVEKGTIVAETTEAETLLQRLRAHYEKRVATTAGPAVLVASHWASHGKQRLYVSRLEADGQRSELGWVDLDRQRFSEEAPDMGPVLTHCALEYNRVIVPARR